jgi:hypothetical protein
MRLTKRKALELTKELWEWLAKDGTRRKGDWPKWEELGEFNSHCPCCEYARRNGKWPNHCSYCPLSGKWKGRNEPYECCHGKSPYHLWWFSEEKRECQKYARKIVKLCDEALAELKGGKQ